jgi:hypothetical protein
MAAGFVGLLDFTGVPTGVPAAPTAAGGAPWIGALRRLMAERILRQQQLARVRRVQVQSQAHDYLLEKVSLRYNEARTAAAANAQALGSARAAYAVLLAEV